jgi:hypothetical protein
MSEFQIRKSIGSYSALAYLQLPKLLDSIRYINLINTGIALLFLLVFLIGAKLDKAYFIRDEGIGLFEHPGIFVFLLAQILIPSVLIRSTIAFVNIPKTGASIISKKFLEFKYKSHLDTFFNTISRRNNIGRLAYSMLVSIGVVVFIWNTYQNQQPFRFLGFDFWDSICNPWGYSATRVYKFYIWVMLIPAYVHIQFSLVLAVRRLLRSLENEEALELEPYHIDACGGVKVFIDTVLNPMVPVVFVSSALTLSAFMVHGKFDITTIGGLAMTCLVVAFVYFIPVLSLRRTIRTEKNRKLDKIGRIQNNQYRKIVDGKLNPDFVKEATEIINALAGFSITIRKIPNWPQLDKVARLFGLAMAPQFFAILLKYFLRLVLG